MLRAAAAAGLLEMSCSMLPLLATLSLLLPDWSTTQAVLSEDYKYGHQCSDQLDQPHNCSWKCIVFTQQWPGGFCQSLYNETHCRIAQSINNWTIHGLWPLRDQYCCSCWPMFHSDVEELETDLTEYWPSLLKTRTQFQFWRGEWYKHGACAACVEGFNSPQKYFQICLKLRQQFDISRILEAAGITPSCKQPYKVQEVRSVLEPHLGVKHEIQCVKDRKDREVLFQVKVQLTRNLTVGCDHHGDADRVSAFRSGSCSSSGHPCPPEIPFYYFPIMHQEPWRPCD
uniref:Uncharacterized protein n=1 Tax=Nothobranchius pienaari TaxID=704102 RepID=A0A1A8QFF8_9TELE